MNAADFRKWQTRLKLKDIDAMRALGIGSRNTLKKYQEEGAPLYIGLACAAVAAGLPPWTRPTRYEPTD